MTWTLTYIPAVGAPVTKDFATWGLSDLKINLKQWGTDTMTFRAPGRDLDTPPLFPYKGNIVICNSIGVQVFVGIVTKLPVKGSAKAEDQFYIISGPWWYLENLVFENEWMIDPLGDGTLVPTLRTTTIIGNQASGVRLDLGQMATIVLNYVLSTAAASMAAFVPFQAGTMTPDTTIPFSEVSNETCAQLLITFFSFVPDAMQEFDYSTTPPTLNISQRGNGTPISLPAYGAPVDDIDLVPRDDLVVPAVVIKYAQTNTIDGVAYSTITPDVYPVGAQNPAFGNLVADVELLPGNLTFLKQPITVTDRPKDYDSIAGTGALSSVTWDWLTGEHRAAWLKAYTIPANWPAATFPFPANPTDQDVVIGLPATDFIVRRVATTLVSNATTPLILPSGTVPPGGGPGTGAGGNALDYLGAELLTGSVTKWMTSSQSVYSAHAKISICIQYIGNDPVVEQWFSVGPTRILQLDFPAMITNGSSQTYTQPASGTPSEPIPIGLAKNIYQGLSVRHYQGTISLTEQECSGVVGMGNVLNLTGGTGPAAAWETMNAQIFEIEYDLDKGKTKIRVGPPVNLDASKLTEILRAIRGRIESWHVDQQTTGKADSDNSVTGAGDTARSGAHTPPGGSATATPTPYSGSDASAGATPQVGVLPGLHNGFLATIYGTPLGGASPPVLVVSAGTGLVYVQVDFTYDGSNNVTVTDNMLNYVIGSTIPASTITPSGGGGSGTLYQSLFQFIATVTSAKASVKINPLVGGSQNFGVCGGAISGPWGV